MNWLRRLDVRLFLSYAIVVLVGAATFAVTFGLLGPSVFDSHLPAMGAMRRVSGSGARSDSHGAFIDALRIALPIAVLVSVAVAALVAGFVARRILRPIDAVRHAASRLAAGHYDERIDEPDELELAALAHDVNRLVDALATTEHRRTRLIGEVAHEMRTPLTTIDGYVEGILDGVFEPTEEVLTKIGEESSRLTRLSADLASLSRAEEGALELQPAPTDLARLTIRVSERLRPQFDGKGVILDVDLPPALPARLDEQRTSQILTNLLGNALTYTDSGGTVTVRATPTGDRARVEITDSGVGLAPDEVEQVFDRFYRVPGVARPAGGSGIGLTIARSLARAQGGEIRAQSAGRGLGATFTLELPAGR